MKFTSAVLILAATLAVTTEAAPRGTKSEVESINTSSLRRILQEAATEGDEDARKKTLKDKKDKKDKKKDKKDKKKDKKNKKEGSFFENGVQTASFSKNVIVKQDKSSDGKVRSESAQCKNSVPEAASKKTMQRVDYGYQMHLKDGMDAEEAANYVEKQLQRKLAPKVLDCSFSSAKDMDWHGVASTPLDKIKGECEAKDANSKCYNVNGAMTADLFFNDETSDSNRRLADNYEGSSMMITDGRIAKVLGPILKELYQSGDLSSGLDEIAATAFQGFTNVDGSVAPDGDSGYYTISSEDRKESGATALGVAAVAVATALALMA